MKDSKHISLSWSTHRSLTHVRGAISLPSHQYFDVCIRNRMGIARGVKHNSRRIARDVSSIKAGDFAAAFVLPVTRNRLALCTRERRGKVVKLGLLGGKPKMGEDSFATTAREAREESGGGRGGGFSDVALARLTRGAGIIDGAFGVFSSRRSKDSVAFAHDLVTTQDLDVQSRFPRESFESEPQSKTTQLGLVWVSLDQIKDAAWREANMHFIAKVLVGKMANAL